MPSRVYSIAVIAGDGIGLETTPSAMSCVDTLASRYGFEVRWTEYPWGSAYYRTHRRMMASDAIERLAQHDAILLGAVGEPGIPDAETLWGLLIPIRRSFDQYINLRPVRSVKGVRPRVIDADVIDLVIVRENVEGEYSTIGGRIGAGQPHELAVQESVFTRAGIARTAKFALELANERRGLLASATKSNGIIHTMPFWDEVVNDVAEAYPDVTLDKILIDALAAKMVSQPGAFDVIVASNLFGDILSDLAAGIAGSIGLAPSANLNPERTFPSMFEPVHGSAPDIAGRGIANPVGQMWAASMMLSHLGEDAAASELVSAFERCLDAGVCTRDLGGTATTSDFTEAVNSQIVS